MEDNLSQPATRRLPRGLTIFLCGAAIALLACCSIRQVVAWRTWGDLENEGGMWTTLAVDAADGVLYRPLVSSLGYGGTRYGPVHIEIQALLIKAGMPPITSGFLIGLATTAVTLAGFFVLMRRLDVPLALALSLTVFFLAAFCVRSGILSIKSDLLAAGLDMWGLVAALPLGDTNPQRKKGAALLVSALLFAVVTAAKITSLFGICTVFTWLIFRRQVKTAAALLGIYLAISLLFMALIQWQSQGRALGIFFSAASAGGGINRLMGGPAIFFRRIFLRDRAVGGFWAIALLMILARGSFTSLSTLLFVYSTLGTIAIFGSPGTDMNHLMDLHLASLLVVAVECQAGALAVGVLIIAGLFVLHAAHSCFNDIHDMHHRDVKANLYAALAQVEQSPVNGPMLAQNPLLPIMAGERAYLLDYFLFERRYVRHPEFGDKLISDITNQRFKAVIVEPDLGLNDNYQPSGPWHDLLKLMQTRYELKAIEGQNLVYLPK